MDKGYEGLSVRRQCKLLEINRSELYYQPVGESEENLEIMRLMDEHHLEHPSAGVLGMQDMLRYEGIRANHKRIRRLMRLMGLEALYPKRCLSRCNYAEYIYPYLLRGRKVFAPNDVWSIDITYIPMNKGFMYLTAIIDVATRFIVGWAVSNTLEARVCIEVLEEAIARYGRPGIINSDQGSQFTCPRWVNRLTTEGIQISMDGKGRAKDNIWIERFCNTIKREHIYFNPADDGLELYRGIKSYIYYYNFKRAHQGVGRVRPCELYIQNMTDSKASA